LVIKVILIDLIWFLDIRMAVAFAAVRNGANKPPVFEDTVEEESLFDTLVSKLPPKETWDAEFLLGVLVLGCEANCLASERGKCTVALVDLNEIDEFFSHLQDMAPTTSRLDERCT
jgi:hypothetical protein